MMVLLITIFSIMSISLPTPTASHKAETMAYGSKMEAATEALLRIRDEIVAMLDRQVIELQQIHRALAYAPPPMIVTDNAPRRRLAGAASSQSAVTKPSFFEEAPCLPVEPFVRALSREVQLARATPLARSQVMQPQHTEMAIETMEDSELHLPEPTLDQMLERATLEELNDALASAFAMVSSRTNR